MIKALDFFPVPFQFQIDGSGKGQKTLFGGIFTMLILCVITVYSVFMLQDWIDDRIAPAITNYNIYSDAIQELGDETFIMLQIFSWSELRQDFRENPNRYFHIMMKHNNQKGKETKKTSLKLDSCKHFLGPKDSYNNMSEEYYNEFLCINLTEHSSLQIQNMGHQFIEFDIYKCMKSVADEMGIECKDEQTIDEYLYHPSTNFIFNIIDENYIVNKYNDITYKERQERFQKFVNDNYYKLTPDTVSYLSYSMKQMVVNYTEGSFRPQMKQKKILTKSWNKGAQDFNRNTFINQMKNSGLYEDIDRFLLHGEIRMDFQQEWNIVVYPQIPVFLASLFAIIKLILAAGLLIKLINYVHNKDKMTRTICKNYYQERKDVKMNLNWFRRAFLYLTDGYFLNKKKRISKDHRKYLFFIETQKKFTDINYLFHQIMFLRNAVQIIFTRQQWAALNFVGRRLNLQDDEQSINDFEGIYESELSQQSQVSQTRDERYKEYEVEDEAPNRQTMMLQPSQLRNKPLLNQNSLLKKANHLEELEILNENRGLNADLFDEFLTEQKSKRSKMRQVSKGKLFFYFI